MFVHPCFDFFTSLHSEDYYFTQEWGFNPAEEIAPNSATVKYTEFLLATASGKVEGEKSLGKIATPFEKTKIAAYALGAMTPCMRLYAFLGKEIRELVSPGEVDHPYKKWIDTYSSDDFEVCFHFQFLTVEH